ncbi:MAG: hypothetical protein K6A72_08975 [Lachnospiraceae bacterium]|nr:hypothetical protein [Lachnospiraceae bacterium]
MRVFKRIIAAIITVITIVTAVNINVIDVQAKKGTCTFDAHDLFDTEFYSDEYFKQMNTVIYVLDDIYADDRLSREVETARDYYDSCDHESIDSSHILSDYIAPILDNGYSYMSTYDLTYCWDNDDQIEYFMSYINEYSFLWNSANSTTEYQELLDVYDEYKDSDYDVNPYISHYITSTFNKTLGSYLFDADFYMETYPVLAYLYEYDEKALANHFYTVGMYEGRQGCEDFNVNAYMKSKYSTSSDYKNSENLAKYYVEYAMARHDGSTKTYPATDSSSLQLRLYDPCFDAYLECVNKYRVEEGLDEYEILSIYDQAEANAFTNCRARYDALDRYANAHEIANEFALKAKADGIIPQRTWNGGIAENKYTQKNDPYTLSNALSSPYGVNYALNHPIDLRVNETMSKAWTRCDSHYKAAAQDDSNIYTAQSHLYANRCTEWVDGDHLQKYDPDGDDTTYRLVFTCYFRNDNMFGTSND